ncbi:MAG: DUF6531 domain-containing protein, partial [Actinomycetota bacterium]|nr:DUF6531 domain-containing protein [Actinomycetota bacterium]
MSISSANPDDLNAFTTQAGAATTTLRGQINQLIAAYQAFKSSEASVNASSVAHTLQTFVDQNATDEKFVATVRQAFIDADSHTVLDSTISAQLSRAGVSQSVPGVPTIDDPTLNGMPLNSGMSDDPVCMATGHFVEVEVDLAMPPSIGTLSWERTYNSRFVVDGPLGRGWSSWAGVALVERSDGTVEYRGPDGQLALWIAHGDAFLDNAGVPAIVRRAAEGLDLSWSWSSRHPGATWSFAADGRLLTLRQPGCGVVVASYEDGHLVRLAHEGGRSLLLSWSYERLVAVTASDGRHVRYRYDGPDLVGADRPSGAMAYDTDDHGRIVTVTDADGIQAVRNEYDEDGRVLLQQSPFGRTTRFEYLGRMTVLAGDDQGGPVTLFRHDLVGRLVEMVTAEGTRLERSYDAGGHLVREVDLAGGETRRRFDVAGNLVGELLPGGRERSFTYDRAGRLESSTDEVGTTARYRYDGDARLPSGVDGPLGWSLRYRVEGGMVAGVEDADGVTWDFELDADGQVVAVTDALGGRTALERHPTGEVNAMVLPGGERQVVRRDEAGRMVNVVSATGDAWRSEWSRAGRLTAIVAPDGGRTDCAWGANGTLEA